MEMIRGDEFKFKFKRQTENGETITERPKQMYITFKYNDENQALFQKKLDEGITFDGEYYHVTINPEDTNNLPFGKLIYDIEIIKENDKPKTLKVDELEIKKEVTYACNEV